MTAMSDYLENQITDHVFRGASFTKPTALYIALFTSATTDAGGGTEVSGGSYARQNLPPSNTNWTATQGGTSGASSGTSGQTTNALEILFPQATAAWGTITHMAIMDAVTGGNMLYHGPLTSSKIVNSGDTFKFPIGDAKVTHA